ncbi:MAG: nitrite reductase [Desulfobulbaceae bacterium]|jgi:NAD(P)H-nitrite reductase large subunit|nr:nitrite reductase [Desulfobulbaceae bacterium]
MNAETEGGVDPVPGGSTSVRPAEHITILLPGGLLAPEEMKIVVAVAARFDLTWYATTAQNLRLLGATPENVDAIKRMLKGSGFLLKEAGRFPKPKVCIGLPYCKLGLADTLALSDRIIERFGGRSGVKPKWKIALSGCPACCAGSKLVDVGVVATRKGFDVFAGGKGGLQPKTGKRIARGVNDDEVVEMIGRLADYHDAHTEKKQRMFKLLGREDFPFPVEDEQADAPAHR